MVERIAHRGPDAVGVRSASLGETTVQLGHRRLSIIDLSTESDQPFVKDGLWLSYNGELYNYREIRAVLESHGVRFVTRSDTEVVLEALRLWGPDALPRFRGISPSPTTTSGTGACSWPATRWASSRCT